MGVFKSAVSRYPNNIVVKTVHSKYVFFNGEFVKEDRFSIGLGQIDWFQHYIYEHIKLYNSKLMFFAEHFKMLKQNARDFDIPLLISESVLKNVIIQLINKNKHFNNTTIRIKLFKPSNTADPLNSILIESYPDSGHFPFLNTEGVLLGLFPDALKQRNKYSSLKMPMTPYYISALNWINDHQLDDCLLLNERQSVAGGLQSAVFIAQERTVLTPSLKAGALRDCYRDFAVSVCQKFGFNVYEEDAILLDDFLMADECFLVDSKKGIRWVKGFGKKRYNYKIAREINGMFVKRITERSKQVKH